MTRRSEKCYPSKTIAHPNHPVTDSQSLTYRRFDLTCGFAELSPRKSGCIAPFAQKHISPSFGLVQETQQTASPVRDMRDSSSGALLDFSSNAAATRILL